MPFEKGKIPEGAKPFKKGQSGNPNGRPRKVLNQINKELEEAGYAEASKIDIISTYMRLLNMDIPKIEQLIKDKQQPALIRIVGKNMLSGRGFDIIEKLLDRGLGRPTQSMEHHISAEQPLFPEE